jgi:hypothetical protein
MDKDVLRLYIILYEYMDDVDDGGGGGWTSWSLGWTQVWWNEQF